jgi:hypothetical protein
VLLDSRQLATTVTSAQTAFKMRQVRLIKWVGDPRLVKEDGWGVPNWRYENNRIITMGDKRCKRVLQKDDGCDYALNPDGTPNLSRPIRGTGIKGEYHFDGQNSILEVPFGDARIILAKAGNEFKDVTDSAHPEEVVNDVIVVPAKKKADSRVAQRT